MDKMLIATGVGAFTLGALVGGGVIYITQRHKRVIEGQARQKDLDYYGNIIGEQIEQIRQATDALRDALLSNTPPPETTLNAQVEHKPSSDAKKMLDNILNFYCKDCYNP